jgi:uncharacterized protein (TIGR02246 family)
VLTISSLSAQAQATPSSEADIKAIQELSQQLVEAYNQSNAEGLAGLFLPDAELIDDAGNAYRGRDDILDVFTRFIGLFPDAKMELKIDSVRLTAGDLAIEKGTRTVTTGQSEKATNRYTMVYVKRDGKWQIAVAQEVPDDPTPTPHDRLEPLAWLVGEWVDEDAEAAISITCSWDPSGNFLLVDFVARNSGEIVMQSRQRLGWDPLAKTIRSWVFDSDGGFGEGRWTLIDGNWIVKSSAVLPDGTTGSATLYFEPAGADRFTMKGFDRVLGNSMEPDFEAVIVRKPPQPAQ